MPSETIIIEGINADHTLQLSDRGHTRTKKNAVITWKIKNQSGVAAITSITPKSNSVDIFRPGDPKPVGGSTNWRGVIKDLTAPATEEYSIGYRDEHEKSFVHDPKISVNTVIFSFAEFKKNLVLLALSLFALFSLSALFARKNRK